MVMANQTGRVDETVARQALSAFRAEFYRCLHKRADAMFELCDAVLCASGAGDVVAGTDAGSGAPARSWGDV
jgi:hypothetical protein